jgi:hypothetical protein
VNSFQAEEKSEGGKDNREDSSFSFRQFEKSEASARLVRNGPVSPSADPDLVSRLATSLYDIGRHAGVKQAFAGANLTALGSLLREFSPEEITEAWREHLEGCTDDFLLKQAVYKFCQGAGRTIALSQRQRANEEREREQEEARANRERRLRSLIGQHAQREMLKQEHCVREEYSSWLDAHDENKDFAPGDEAAFDRYKARDDKESARQNGVSLADRYPLDRRLSDLERSAVAELMADPRIIAAAKAELEEEPGTEVVRTIPVLVTQVTAIENEGQEDAEAA